MRTFAILSVALLPTDSALRGLGLLCRLIRRLNSGFRGSSLVGGALLSRRARLGGRLGLCGLSVCRGLRLCRGRVGERGRRLGFAFRGGCDRRCSLFWLG